MTLLTIYTPTFRRPTKLTRCRASVAAQTSQDYQHVVVEDHIGLGVAGMFRDIPNHHHAIAGEYVYFLSDDDVLTDPNFVEDLQGFLDASDRPDVVMVKATIGEYTFPLFWEKEPVLASVTLSNWIVKKEIWTTVPYGGRYEGDFDFIDAVWKSGARIAWWDRHICHADGWGQGRPE